GRPVTLILSTFNELLDEVFTTRNLSASLEEEGAVYFTEQQLERLLLLLKEGGGQLKDGSKTVEFTSSLMALVPRRLAIDQRKLLFNAVHDMINYCLAVSADMPSIRPALDRLFLSCSMCGAFAPDQKMTVIETARIALSVMMMTESMQERGSPRARRSARSTSTIMNQSDGQRTLPYGGMPEDAGFRSRNRHMHPSPRPFQSPFHASGMVGSETRTFPSLFNSKYEPHTDQTPPLPLGKVDRSIGPCMIQGASTARNVLRIPSRTPSSNENRSGSRPTSPAQLSSSLCMSTSRRAKMPDGQQQDLYSSRARRLPPTLLSNWTDSNPPEDIKNRPSRRANCVYESRSVKTSLNAFISSS
ncbi:hypothetical protein CF327_g6264, partial [Tilletia walkeri]